MKLLEHLARACAIADRNTKSLTSVISPLCSASGKKSRG